MHPRVKHYLIGLYGWSVVALLFLVVAAFVLVFMVGTFWQ